MSIPDITTMDEARALLDDRTKLLSRAELLRKEVFGTKIDLCAIINAKSGNCTMDCAFCSQSAVSHAQIPTHPLLSSGELTERLLTLATLPVAHIGLVTSGGKLSDEEVESLATTISALPEVVRARICASLGRLSQENLGRLVRAGLRRFHHNLESAEGFYPRICTRQTWQSRLDTVLRARAQGLSNCTGGLFGMGESWDDRIDLALTLKAHNIHHVPINFLYPHPNTPLAQREPLDADTALCIIALFRHILPRATLRICGGRPTTLLNRQDEIFAAGANALMIGDYLTTKGAGAHADLAMLERLGLKPSVRPALPV